MRPWMRAQARDLRKNATKEERKLWYRFLRTFPLPFRRQAVFGPYIVDFYCPAAKLVVELDGSQHFQDQGPEADARRTAYLEKTYHLTVLRLSNLDIQLRFKGACDTIARAALSGVPPSASLRSAPSPIRGEGGQQARMGGRSKFPAAKERTAPSKRRSMKTVTIYTDGACSGNPGPGGWGAVLLYGAHRRELSGGEAQTTNNRMELTAVISALSLLKEPCVVELWSDSKYVIDGLSKGWAKGWKARGWVKSDKKPALNPDLWDELLRLTEIHTLHYHWVKGHADTVENNRCDELAVMESRKFK